MIHQHKMIEKSTILPQYVLVRPHKESNTLQNGHYRNMLTDCRWSRCTMGRVGGGGTKGASVSYSPPIYT